MPKMTSTSTSPSVTHKSHDVLEKLEELSIKGLDFAAEDDSPSYGTASLPTPEAPHVVFNLPMTAGMSPFHASSRHLWYEDDEPIKVPGAPLIKDLDSFTDGTGHGSFENLPVTATNEHGDFIYTTTPMTLALLPPSESLFNTIERWRENVFDDTSLPIKRRRSPSPADEPYVRRIRPRTRAISLPPTFKAPAQFMGVSITRSEPEPPD